MFSHIPALMLREWMQHKRGWLLTLILPPALVLALLPFGEAHGLPTDQPLAAGVIVVMGATMALLVIAGLSAAFQLPGLARRDVQDRSIEFWLSLPAGNSESLMATLLAHVMLVPLAAVVFGFGVGYVITAGVALKMAGFAGLAAVPWGQVTVLVLPAMLRVAFGVVLALVWLAPLVLMVMATAAWLKRWAVAAIAAATVITTAILPKLYGFVLIRDWLNLQMTGAWHALLANPKELASNPAQMAAVDSTEAWHWAVGDAVHELQALLSWQVASGLAVAALCFYLLVLRRQRAG
jgi:hypothetical protein